MTRLLVQETAIRSSRPSPQSLAKLAAGIEGFDHLKERASQERQRVAHALNMGEDDIPTACSRQRDSALRRRRGASPLQAVAKQPTQGAAP